LTIREGNRDPIGNGFDVEQYSGIRKRYEVTSGTGIRINRMGSSRRKSKLGVGVIFVNEIILKIINCFNTANILLKYYPAP
jgi:hypothetical protein